MATESKEEKLSVVEKYRLITRGLVGEDGIPGDTLFHAPEQEELQKLLASEVPVKLYWGTATTSSPHIAYFLPMKKIRDFLEAGVEVTILFADLHALIDDLKNDVTEELLTHRVNFYEAMIKAVLMSIGVDLTKVKKQLKFIRGSSFQQTPKYLVDFLRLSKDIGQRDAAKAGCEVVKQSKNPKVADLLYPIMQVLDEEYLGVDIQFGGLDQRKIFTLAQDRLPAIKYRKRIHLMNPMIPTFTGGAAGKGKGESADGIGNKMSSSSAGSLKIDLLDSSKDVDDKIKRAFAAPGETKGNGMLAFIKHVLLPLGKLGPVLRSTSSTSSTDSATSLVVEELHHYSSYEELEQDYTKSLIWPANLKTAVASAINVLLEPIREFFSSESNRRLIQLAYPPKITVV